MIFMEPGLHENPEKLKDALQKMINQLSNVDFILLGYALCGNGLIGLTSKNATLVLPQYHDCIAMLLGSNERYRANLGSEIGGLFLTGGWLKYFNPKQKFYEDWLPRFGHDKALKYGKRMLADYKRIILVENESYDVDATFLEMREPAKFFGLEEHRMRGTLDVIRKLVKGEWDGNFQIVPPGRKTELWDLV
ncbi:Protein of unknown function [Desulfotomaculum arcticum]|uniref:DUF1638 domain-containing protein n=1 Tax=Desulfotruncus arcticus DSM 17038 TaxID=1121424 RepID=A0A1I2XZW7_9FIRM|nr:Protein of unknown function [Desulfotomaculum arcticum] [Desulfotruncus arcticus DSM 17038]